MNKIKVAIAAFLALLTIGGTVAVESVPSASDVVPVVEQADEAAADQIRTAACGWEGNSHAASAYCPTRWYSGGPQKFRITFVCVGPPGYIVVYGAWKLGGNWTPSSASCPFSYPGRVTGSSTYIQYQY